jgi:hypothetical protein
MAAARSGGRTFGHSRMTSIDKMVHDLNLKPQPEDATRSENEDEAEEENDRDEVPKVKSVSSKARGVLEARDPNQRTGAKMGGYKGKTKKARKQG